MNSSYHSNFSSGLDNDASDLRGQDFKKSDSILYGFDPVTNANEPLRKRHRHLLKHQQKTIYDECLDGSAFGTNQAPGSNFASNNSSSGNNGATKHPFSNGNSPDAGLMASAVSTFVPGESTADGNRASGRFFVSGRLIRFSTVLILLCCILAIAIFYLLFGTSADLEGDDQGLPDEQAPDDTISSLLGFYGNLDIDDEDL